MYEPRPSDIALLSMRFIDLSHLIRAEVEGAAPEPDEADEPERAA